MTTTATGRLRSTLWFGSLLLVAVVVLGSAFGQPIGLAFVETGSMAPTLEPGDGFVAVPAPVAGDVEPGDVVTFREPNGRLTTHRVVDETDDGFVTRGDANAFTDQQGGAPLVARDRVVAVAAAPGGSVLVVPGFGGIVAAMRGVFDAFASLLGLDDPGQLAATLVVVAGTVLVLDELLAESSGTRSESRSHRRDDGYRVSVLVAGIVLAVVGVATATMLLSSGATAVPYDSVAPDERVRGGIESGESRAVSLSLSNPGFVPSVAVLSAPGGATTVADGTVVLGPRSNATVNATVTAPSTTGRYEARVVQHRYVGVLPASAIGRLHAVDPWVARGAVDAALGLVAFVLARSVLGRARGRLRLAPTRTLPVDLSLKRRLRRLYR